MAAAKEPDSRTRTLIFPRVIKPEASNIINKKRNIEASITGMCFQLKAFLSFLI
ncbi:hypothetical protein [Methanolobus sp.]|uniref:hypothetical protein n=1 Tax=Methanolobus sp. TaxID=1874737 RepID=UPI00272F3FD4|nr:hypothetical protein [Methanolobus sp.]